MLKAWNDIDERRIAKSDLQVKERTKVRRKELKRAHVKKQDAFMHVERTMYESAGYHPDKPGPSDPGHGRGRGQGGRGHGRGSRGRLLELAV